jgi:hypothetical protein
VTTPSRLIRIPRTDWNGHGADMRSRLVTWQWYLDAEVPATLELDFTQVRFMEPWALSMWAAFGIHQRQRGAVVRCRFDPDNLANQYMVAMGLGAAMETATTTAALAEWQDSARNTGLHLLRTEADLGAFRRSTHRLALQHCEQAADALRYVLTELGRNVLQHSWSSIGGVAIAQHFPDDQRLQIAVCDLGRGVLQSLAPRHPELRTDMEALRLATLPHASGAEPAGPYGGAENAGIGLFYAREIAWRSGGSMWFCSGNALLGVRGDRADLWEERDPAPDRVYRRIEGWPGTVVVVDFPVDGVPDFEGILQVCSGLAAEARRMSGPAGLDFLGDAADTEQTFIVNVLPFEEDNSRAIEIRRTEIKPRIERGEAVILDFRGVRAPTQSFVHALLAEVFQVPGSLVRLSFRNCSGAAKEILKAVAAYASYRRIM